MKKKVDEWEITSGWEDSAELEFKCPFCGTLKSLCVQEERVSCRRCATVFTINITAENKCWDCRHRTQFGCNYTGSLRDFQLDCEDREPKLPLLLGVPQ